MTIESHGVRFGFVVTDPAILPLLTDWLPWGWRTTTGPRVHRLYSLDVPIRRRNSGIPGIGVLLADGQELSRGHEPEALLEALEGDLRHYVAEHARRRVFVHAGVVGYQGKAILLPGRSFSGKSTLVGELIRRGAAYYSDEYAVLDARGRVHPFAKPLSIREGVVLKRTTRRTPQSFGGLVGLKPLPVGLVVLCRFRPGGRFRPRPLTPGQGTLEMVAHTVSARRAPASALEALGQVASRAVIVKSFRGEAGETAERILKLAEALEA